MIRRSFRLGLFLGIAAGVAYLLKSRRSASEPAALPPGDGAPWPEIADRTPAVAPEAPTTATVAESPEPAAPSTASAEEAPTPESPSSDSPSSPSSDSPDSPDSPDEPEEADETDAETSRERSGPRPAAKARATRGKARATKRTAKARPKRATAKGSAQKGGSKKRSAKKVRPKPVADAPVGSARSHTGWVLSTDESTCPSSHPVKANMNSKIFHVPGGLSYERTNPDRCYADAETAEADGLRQAKR